MEPNSYDFQVKLKYQVYNSIFLTLHFATIRKTGIALPVFSEYIVDGLAAGKDPRAIITQFFEDHKEYLGDEEQKALLFRIIQYVERQVVLIDALEEAAFPELHVQGVGALVSLAGRARTDGQTAALQDALNDFRVKLVLTAHPTQFYPGNVLGIINDLSEAFSHNDLYATRMLLEQLGQTPFFVKEKPSPYDEAVSLSWYLEHIFYHAIPQLVSAVRDISGRRDFFNYRLIELGFWPGGDRDGNPFVTTEITLKVARRLRFLLLKVYYNDVRLLKRRLTFKRVSGILEMLEATLRKALFEQGHDFDLHYLQDKLDHLRELVVSEYNGFCVDMVDSLLLKTRIFGRHFAALDIRQDSRVIQQAFEHCFAEPVQALEDYFGERSGKNQSDDPVIQDVLDVFGIIRQIQQENGEHGCNRFIISNCRAAENVLQVYALASALGMGSEPALDIVPLFETIADLKRSDSEMERLYTCSPYLQHLTRRGGRQYIMLGFSDGTKDGGYFAANWHILKTKERLTALARKYRVEVVFFDGRGGPPARGGGNVRKYYASQGNNIGFKEIQITVQGQTVSSRFSTIPAAVHFLGNLLSAGLENRLYGRESAMSKEEEAIMQRMADESYLAYTALREDEGFIPFLERRSPLRFFGQTNIGSRPSRRGGDTPLTLDDLRAIPFVGSWSTMKLNVPGYYGFGKAMEACAQQDGLPALKKLFAQNPFFESLVSNSMQSISKTRLDITAYLKHDPEFSAIWEKIREENERSRKMIGQLLGDTSWDEVLDSRPSISLREEVVLPLLVIQQYALMQLERNPEHSEVYEKLIIRTLYGIINAARNSA